jgi:hypothetical protein
MGNGLGVDDGGDQPLLDLRVEVGASGGRERCSSNPIVAL